MERKEFLTKLGIVSLSLLGACKLNPDDNGLTSCIAMRSEEEGPWPYPGGEVNNPLNKSDITGGQSGIPLALTFLVVNVTGKCAPLSGISVHIWHCNKDGYYSGYAKQDGAAGIKDFTGETWLRGYQNTDGDGIAKFKTIYPGWESGRATHIHVEVFANGVLRRTGQLAFPEQTNTLVNASAQYSARGDNPTKNTKDSVFSEDLTALASETLPVNGTVDAGFIASYMIGITL